LIIVFSQSELQRQKVSKIKRGSFAVGSARPPRTRVNVRLKLNMLLWLSRRATLRKRLIIVF